jgi:hypothetical protein
VTKEDAVSAQAPAQAKAAAPAVATIPLGERSEQRVPMTRLRARIAERLLQSKNENAILTTFNEVDMSAVMALRNQYKEQFEKTHKSRLGFMSFFVKATVKALKEFPGINAEINGVSLAATGRDLLEQPAETCDVILVGDLFYEKGLAAKVFAWLEDAEGRGIVTLIGDPGRSYLPREKLKKLGEYKVQVTRDLEDAEVKLTSVWRLSRYC